MTVDLPTKLFNEVQSPIIGFSFTKHFWERYVQRFKNDLTPFEGLIKRIDRDLVLLIFQAASCAGFKQVVIEHQGAKIPLVLMENKFPELKATTIYS